MDVKKETKDFEIKITKRQLIKEGYFGWEWHLIQSKLYLLDENGKPTSGFYRVKFIIDFDRDEIFDYFVEMDNEKYTLDYMQKNYNKLKKEYLNICISSFLDGYTIKQIYEQADNTINQYKDNYKD